MASLMHQATPRLIEKNEVFELQYSVCTLVTDKEEYREMETSFRDAGFTGDSCEYLYIDNSSGNTFEAYAGLNRFLREAKGQYIMICHQDILLKDHGLAQLNAKIAEIEDIDPRWAVLGNAGGVNIKHRGLHLINNSGREWHEPELPLRTATLDENFIVIKKSANLSLSGDLSGFHFYGADICLIADVLGYSSYIIDFKLIHKSDGKDDEKFYELKSMLIRKYGRAFRSRFIGTTITRFYLSGNSFLNAVCNTKIVLFFARQFYKAFRPKSRYHTKLKG